MTVISADGLAAPELPSEEHDCPPLGGAVRIRALLLSERLQLESRLANAPKADDGSTVANWAIVPEVLAATVVDAKDRPVYSVRRWDVFGSAHAELALALFNAAWRLSGMSGDAAKKS